MNEKRSTTRRLNFTQKALDALKCPQGEDRFYAYDTVQRGLGIRVTSTGRKSFVFVGKARGRMVRETLGEYFHPDGMTVEAARKLAAKSKVRAGNVRSSESFTVEEAFTMALGASKRGEKARTDWDYAKKRFDAFMEERFPSVKKWEKISRPMISEYLRSYEGKSDTHKRLSLQPIRQTSRHMSIEHGCQDVAAGLRLGSRLSKPPASVYMKDVLALLDHLKNAEERARMEPNGRTATLEVGAALQSLAGLQLQEALRLDWSKVDLKRGLIEVSGEVKNEFRNRVIPVCARVLDSLKRAYALRSDAKIQDLQEHVVLSERGFPFDGQSWFNYGKLLLAEMKRWNPKIEWKAKDLRNCLLTLSVVRGVHSIAWETYVGHSPKSVTAKHYVPRLASVTEGEQDALNAQMNVFKKLVVEFIENETEAIRKQSEGEDSKAKVVRVGKR